MTTAPPSPLHVKPDEEVRLPENPTQLDDLELNPDLELDADGEDEVMATRPEAEAPVLHNDPGLPTDVTSWTLPFDEAFESLKQEFFGNARHAALSNEQQSKFVGYLDGEILQIQRKFVKNQSEAAVTYTLQEVLSDLVPVLDLVWYSVHENGALFGQDEYYVRILGDLDDWLSYYSFPAVDGRSSTAFYATFFSVMQSVDTRISFLMDGFPVGEHRARMSPTAVVRLSPIVNRIRMTIISKIDAFKAHGSASSSEMWNVMDVEIGRLFEGILDRL